MDEQRTILYPANLTLNEIRSKLAGFHFSKESLTKGERDILILAETLLNVLNDLKKD